MLVTLTGVLALLLGEEGMKQAVVERLLEQRRGQIEDRCQQILSHTEDRRRALLDYAALPNVVHAVMQAGEDASVLADMLAQVRLIGRRYPVRLVDFAGEQLLATAGCSRGVWPRPWLKPLLAGQVNGALAWAEVGAGVIEVAAVLRYEGVVEGALIAELPLHEVIRAGFPRGPIMDTILQVGVGDRVLLELGDATVPTAMEIPLGIGPIRLGVGIDDAALERELASVRQPLLLSGLVFSLVLGLLGGLLVRRLVTRPITELSDCVDAGDLNGVGPIIRRRLLSRETLNIGMALQRMGGQLEAREAELRAVLAGLEARVEERTSHLQRANQELARAEQKMASLASIPQLSPHPVMEVNLRGQVSYRNATAARDLHLDTLQGESHPLIRAALEIYREDPTAVMEGSVDVQAEFGRKVFQLTLTRPRDSDVLRVYLHDLTPLTDAQSELRRAMEEARAASLAKSEFLASMSHEIRTPMNGIRGMADLLLGTELAALQREFVETIGSSADALVTIVNDILDFSKIEAGHLEIENIDFDLVQVLDEVVDLFAYRADDLGLDFYCSQAEGLPGRLKGDPARLRQVLVNLVGNALKFTEVGSVFLACDCVARGPQGLRLRFAVRDTGVGIPETGRDRLFQRFSQVDNSHSRRFGGTGLGLAICNRLVQLMGGEMAVDSVEGQGSEFSFEILLEAGAVAEPPPQVSLAGKRILLALTGDEHLQGLAQQLGSRGAAQIATATDPRALHDVLSAAASRDAMPDLIVLGDTLFDDQGGIPLAGEWLERSRVLLYCSAAHQQALEAGQRIGIQGVLSRPLRQRELDRAFAAALSLDWREADAERPVDDEKPQGVAGLRVLVVDDNAINRRVAMHVLKRLDCLASEVMDGRAAVEAVAGGSFDLVLMDCQMPGMDGFEATSRIRAAGQDLPIIALTANAMEGERERCMAAGMDDFLAKPFKQAELSRLIQAWTPPR